MIIVYVYQRFRRWSEAGIWEAVASAVTTGNLRCGLLTNGGRWRLYYSGARSVAEQFFELDLAAVLGIAGHGNGLFKLDGDEQRHALRVFSLVFRRETPAWRAPVKRSLATV